METKLAAIGGYSEVGKNMSAFKIGDEAVLLDMGFYLPVIVDFEEEGHDRASLSVEQMQKMGAIPNDTIVSSWRNNVKGILCSHAHLDHTGAVPYLAPRYNAPVIGTPFTLEVLKNMAHSEGLPLKNKYLPLNTGSKYRISKNIEVELINVTHSTPQTAIIAVHTPQGVLVYTNDFKFDNDPVIGKKPDYERLKQLGKEERVLGVIVDSLYSGAAQKTPSERVAREMLKDVMLGTENHNNPMIITCFASHIARLRSIMDFGQKLNRKVVMLGRSMQKYASAAEKVNIVKYSKEAEIVAGADRIKKKLSKMEKEGLNNYLIICTGGQGEPNSVLSKMLNNVYPFYFNQEDTMIFSNRIIPVEPNITNRGRMEDKLKKFGVRIYKDIHVSGHGSREDIRDLINMLNPEHIIPSHGHHKLTAPTAELAVEMGFQKKEIHQMKNGDTITF
ncbi:MAG: RNase J family beta-CASP ribonuclease [Candidatus Woesearchaeota archaeon]|nr:RNase J family beta-CASP ribonuclease [Candidatus Woesearchaeota archaeon]